MQIKNDQNELIRAAEKQESVFETELSKIFSYLILGNGIGLTVSINLIFTKQLGILVYAFFATSAMFAYGLIFGFFTNSMFLIFTRRYAKFLLRVGKVSIAKTVLDVSDLENNKKNNQLTAQSDQIEKTISPKGITDLFKLDRLKKEIQDHKSETLETKTKIISSLGDSDTKPRQLFEPLYLTIFCGAISMLMMFFAMYNIYVVVTEGPRFNFAPHSLDAFSKIK